MNVKAGAYIVSVRGEKGEPKHALRNCTPLAQGTIEPSVNNGFSTWSCKRPQLDLDSGLTGSWPCPHPLIGELSIILVPRPHPHEEKKYSGYNLTSHSTPEGHNQMQSEKSEKWLYNGRYSMSFCMLCRIPLPLSSKQNYVYISWSKQGSCEVHAHVCCCNTKWPWWQSISYRIHMQALICQAREWKQIPFFFHQQT